VPDNFAQRAPVSHLLPRRGPAQAAGFFTVIGGWTVLDFVVLDIIGAGRQVVAAVRAAFEMPRGCRFAGRALKPTDRTRRKHCSSYRHRPASVPSGALA
jgi:hypothetical protein